MGDYKATSSLEWERLGQCRCASALKGIPNTPIQHGTSIATGLTWARLQALRCVQQSCIFCQSLDRDYSPMNQAQTAREVMPCTDEMRFLRGAQLVLDFTTMLPHIMGYACLSFSTKMASPTHIKWTRSPMLNVVGYFERPGLETASQLVARRLVPAQFDPSILRNWLASCEQHHGHEQIPRDKPGPLLKRLVNQKRLRFIDVRTHALVTATAPERYLALSYVWGESHVTRDISLPSSAYELCSKLGPSGHLIEHWESLPRTIREAAAVVKDIGERYLWVDAICINQNDPEDRQCIVAEMGAIYGASLVTIVSTGDHANTGLPGVSFGSRSAETCIELPIGSATIQLVPSLEPLDPVLRRSKWSERGWTFQEYLLSRRTVTFAPNQVYFTCAKGEQAEGYPAGGLCSDHYWRDRVHRQRMPKDLSDRTVCNMIQEFSQRRLTHHQDRFNAFIGVATLHSPEAISTDTQIALRGLSARWFWESLLWSTPLYADEPLRRIKTNLDESLALPSWSWVGWTGFVGWTRPLDSPSSDGNPTYDTEPRAELMVLDNANIVLKPTRNAKRSASWEDWPFEPRSYSARVPNSVTLHMWAPCVDCHLIPTTMSTNTLAGWHRPGTGPTAYCAILMASPELTVKALDDLDGLSSDVMPERPDFLGYISRPKESPDAQQHRKIHQLAIFPRSNATPGLILLVENPDDPGTVCREDYVNAQASSGEYDGSDGRGVSRASGNGIWAYARHRYIRMQ